MILSFEASIEVVVTRFLPLAVVLFDIVEELVLVCTSVPGPPGLGRFGLPK
jgi:hypothetical protein